MCFQTEPSVPVYRFNLLSSLTVNTGVSPYLQVKLCAAVPVKVTKLNVKGGTERLCVDFSKLLNSDCCGITPGGNPWVNLHRLHTKREFFRETEFRQTGRIYSPGRRR